MLEEMLYGNIKAFEIEIKKFIRGNPQNSLEKDFDLITNNPFASMKITFEGDLT